MDALYQLPTPYITKKSVYPEEFLTISEFISAVDADHIKVKGGKFRKGKGTRGRLNLYLADDKKNISRPVYIELKGLSSFGVSKYKEFYKPVTDNQEAQENEEQVEKKEHSRKNGEGSWSIVFSLEENTKIQGLSEKIDEFVKAISKSFLPKIYDELCDIKTDSDLPITIYRQSAKRSSSGVRFFRLTVLPGGTEFGTTKDLEVVQSLSDFAKDNPGLYRVVFQLSHIDATYDKDILTLSAILYARIVRSDFPLSVKKRKFRESGDDV